MRTCAVLLSFWLANAAAGGTDDISVQAVRKGAVVEVTARATVDAPLSLIWGTLTDFNRFAEFIPGMRSSRHVEQRGNDSVVEQSGEARFLFFTFPIEVTLLSTSRPPEALSVRVLKGNLKRLDGSYRIEPLADGRYLLRFLGHAESSIGLRQTVQGFRRMGGRVVLGEHRLKSVDGRQMLVAKQVVPPDFHLLASEMIDRQVQLDTGVAGINTVGIARYQLLESVERELSHLLVAADVGYLLVVTKSLEIEGIGGIRIGRMELDKAVEGNDRVVVLVELVMSISGHQLRLGRPSRIRMLTLDLVELLCGDTVVFCLQGIHGGVVELGHRALDVLVFLLACAGAK